MEQPIEEGGLPVLKCGACHAHAAITPAHAASMAGRRGLDGSTDRDRLNQEMGRPAMHVWDQWEYVPLMEWLARPHAVVLQAKWRLRHAGHGRRAED